MLQTGSPNNSLVLCKLTNPSFYHHKWLVLKKPLLWFLCIADFFLYEKGHKGATGVPWLHLGQGLRAGKAGLSGGKQPHASETRVWWTTEQHSTRQQHSILLQRCSRVFLGAALTLWQHLAIETLGSRGWGQEQPRARQVFPELQSQNTSGLVTQVNAQAVAALFPQDSSFHHQGEAPSNSVLLQKSHSSDSALNTKFLTLARDAKWLTGVVIWGLQWCLLLLKHPCYRAQGWGWGESAPVFGENRSHGSDEHAGVRVKIWLYLLTRMIWLFRWLCSSALKKASCLISQQSNARAIVLYLQCTAWGFTVLLLCLHSPSLWKILNYSRGAQIRIKQRVISNPPQKFHFPVICHLYLYSFLLQA